MTILQSIAIFLLSFVGAVLGTIFLVSAAKRLSPEMIPVFLFVFWVFMRSAKAYATMSMSDKVEHRPWFMFLSVFCSVLLGTVLVGPSM